MGRFVRITAAIALIWSVGCSGHNRCRDVCQREAECAEQAGEKGQRFDQAECVSVCRDLERDTEGQKIVDQHAQCVAAATDCAAVLRCQ